MNIFCQQMERMTLFLSRNVFSHTAQSSRNWQVAVALARRLKPSVFLFARRERRGRRGCVDFSPFGRRPKGCYARMVSGMKGSLFNTNCHELPVNFREYFYILTLISRKPQMTLITRIILSTEFKQITQNFASRCALARRLG